MIIFDDFDGYNPKAGPHCMACEAMLADAVDETLGEVDRVWFNQHIETCVVCSERFANAQRGSAWLEMLKTHAAGAESGPDEPDSRGDQRERAHPSPRACTPGFPCSHSLPERQPDSLSQDGSAKGSLEDAAGAETGDDRGHGVLLCLR